MVRLIHAADFHLDSPFAGLDPEQAIRRRAEQRELLGRLAEYKYYNMDAIAARALTLADGML